MLMWMLGAYAGSVFYLDIDRGDIQTFNTRTLENQFLSRAPWCIGTYAPGMAFDAARGELWIYASDYTYGLGDSYAYHRMSDNFQYCISDSGFFATSSSLSFDQNQNIVVAFSSVGTTMSEVPGDIFIQNTGIEYNLAADWYEPGGYHIVLARDGFFAVDGVTTPTLLSPWPPDIIQPWSGEMAWDSDTRLLWLFEYGVVWAVDPTTWDVVALIGNMGHIDGGAGSIDTTPDPTPELLVSGLCPGTVYVTAVDVQPGSEVLVASATRLGTTRAPQGPCAGTAMGLANPRLRTSMIANSAGIATTRIQATQGMCGRLQLQAVEVDTCTPTSVRTVPATLVP
jgi:hypothetical protein